MQRAMEVLNEYAAFIQAVATVGLIIVTWGLWCATKKMGKSARETSEATKLLVDENRRLREDTKTPLILAKLKPMADHGDFLQLVLENLGQGAALNVKFRLEGDQEDFEKHEMIPVRGSSVPINFMSRGESAICDLGAFRTLGSKPPMKPFSVVIEYEDVDRESHEERVVLDVKQFDGLAWPGASVAWRQMAALEGIAKKFKGN